MANICDSTYKIMGDTAELTALYNLMTNIRNTEENGYWVGHIVDRLCNGETPEHLYLRGWWSELQLEENCLSFHLESAWQSLHEVWDFICSKYETLTAYFVAEEPGCEIYVKRDNDNHDFPDNYYVDACDPEGECHEEYFTNIDEAFHFIEKISGENIITADQVIFLNHKWMEEDEDTYIYLHEYTEV